MRILFTGFTSRTVGGRAVYDYLSNVDVLRRSLETLGHVVDQRRVSLTETDLTERYDVAFVGIAACNGLSSRFKLGALWTMSQFGSRAALFPSDGRNVGVFVNSVRTSIRNLDTFLGGKLGERNNVVEHEIGAASSWHPTWLDLLPRLLTGSERRGRHVWQMLVPTFSWGSAEPYARAFDAPVTVWDPTSLAWPMQFQHRDQMSAITNRARTWVMPTLQDNDRWLDHNRGSWPVIQVGNKRKGEPYISEIELINTFYRQNWGTLAFGYPLAEGGWWRMRYVHAAIAGAVTCCDRGDGQVAGAPYRHSRPDIEGMTEPQLNTLAAQQWAWLFDRAKTREETLEVLRSFVSKLKTADKEI